jgi:hypothetical protein
VGCARGTLLVLWWARVFFFCMRDIFILNEIWVKIKYIHFGRHIACVKYVCHLQLPLLTPKSKQHI